MNKEENELVCKNNPVDSIIDSDGLEFLQTLPFTSAESNPGDVALIHIKEIKEEDIAIAKISILHGSMCCIERYFLIFTDCDLEPQDPDYVEITAEGYHNILKNKSYSQE